MIQQQTCQFTEAHAILIQNAFLIFDVKKKDCKGVDRTIRTSREIKIQLTITKPRLNLEVYR